MTTVSTYVDGLVDERVTRSGRQIRTIQGITVHAIDATLITLSLTAVVAARGLLRIEATPADRAIQLGIPLIGLAWMILLQIFGSTNPRHLRAGATEYKRVVSASFSLAAMVGVGAYLLQTEFPRSVFLLAFTFGTAVLLLGRFLRRRAMVALHTRGIGVTPLLVAGDSGHVDAVAQVLRRETWLGYRVVGAVTSDRQQTTPAGLPILGQIDETVSLVDDLGVHGVIFAEGSFSTPADFRRTAWQLEAKDIQMIVVPAVSDVSAQRLEIRPVAGLPLMDVDRPQAIAATRWIKRTFDIVGSSLLLLAAAPVMALVALAIKLEDGGPVMFRQTRVGRKGQTFECLKFRSMVPDAEARLAALAASNEGAGPLFKMTKDPRITRVGRFIRRFSLDELPQFFNTFRGDMSLVGPRPALPSEVAQYDYDARRRLDVRPGLTGLWQVSGRSNLSWDDTVRLDLYYVDNWSLVQDLMILAKTARAVVGSAGAY